MVVKFRWQVDGYDGGTTFSDEVAWEHVELYLSIPVIVYLFRLLGISPFWGLLGKS